MFKLINLLSAIYIEKICQQNFVKIFNKQYKLIEKNTNDKYLFCPEDLSFIPMFITILCKILN